MAISPVKPSEEELGIMKDEAPLKYVANIPPGPVGTGEVTVDGCVDRGTVHIVELA